MWALCLIFFTGLVLDGCITAHLSWVSDGKILKACISNFIYLVLSFTVWKHILIGEQSLLGMIAYAAGATMGCYISLSMKGKKKEKDEII